MKPMRISLLRIGFLALALLGFSSFAGAGEGLFSPAAVPKAKREANPETKCVEPVEIMRRQHMQFLLHQRNKTMHEGIRTPQHSLVECLDCHVQPGSDIHSKEHFCTACHAYAAVRIDCFECHSSQPEPAAATAQPSAPAQPGAPAQPTAGGAQP